ncbi:MAG: ATP-binding protein [Candidatus Alcyoniella australis]|nr:ATP-binding protein [Candidatus Alcyoniella australis]
MLIEFSVANFLSFKERVTFSMLASKASENPENVFQPESASGNLSLLKTAAIYGANASGKSNLIDAFFFMRSFVLNSVKQGSTDQKIARRPFKIDQGCIDKPSYFNLVFIYEGIEYDYGFEIDNHRVHREWLKIRQSKKQALVFDRRFSKAKNKEGYQYKKGTAWQGEWKSIQSVTRPDSLFLSVASQFNNEITENVTDYFRTYLEKIIPETIDTNNPIFTNELALQSVAHKFILNYLKKADLGIVDFNVSKVPLTENQYEFVTAISKIFNRPSLKNEFTDKVKYNYDTTTIHSGVDLKGNPANIEFTLNEESDGTRKFYTLSGPLFKVLYKGSVLIVDELDARLHSLLTRWLIGLFHNPKTNPKNAQLIFATHDAGLLDRKLLRRDQIWFTEKGEDSATKLYSLWDIKIRNKEDIRKGYLMGRYGAIPFLEQNGD